ncbi:hypothetical protein H0H93_016128, partial [Arthromyces matolae]
EFDPQFRLECERMAIRERKRQEEVRKQEEAEGKKDKGKGVEDNGQPNGTRRSGRNNGQQPELAITDPVQLERRLKRQRSNEAATDSHASEEETGEGRDAKRSRMVVDDENDPLNIVSNGVQSRVHFAAEDGPSTQPSGPTNEESTDMVVDDVSVGPSRARGFDPALLNPMSSPDFVKTFPGATTPPVDGQKQPSPPALILSNDPSNPFVTSPSPHPTASTPPAALATEPAAAAELPALSAPSSPQPIPMQVEREPSPLPDFHVDDALVDELKRHLQDETASLTIEELEQLRAT